MAVIVLPGIEPIGAYLVRPVCDWYGVAKTSSSAVDDDDAAASAVSATVLTVAGPAVVVTVNVPDPVIPLIENLLE